MTSSSKLQLFLHYYRLNLSQKIILFKDIKSDPPNYYKQEFQDIDPDELLPD